MGLARWDCSQKHSLSTCQAQKAEREGVVVSLRSRVRGDVIFNCGARKAKSHSPLLHAHDLHRTCDTLQEIIKDDQENGLHALT